FYQARLLDQEAQAVTEFVNLTIRIFSPDGLCLLYEEKQENIDLSLSHGLINIQIGSVIGAGKRGSLDPGLAMSTIFANRPVNILPTGTPNCVAGFTPNA